MRAHAIGKTYASVYHCDVNLPPPGIGAHTLSIRVQRDIPIIRKAVYCLYAKLGTRKNNLLCRCRYTQSTHRIWKALTVTL